MITPFQYNWFPLQSCMFVLFKNIFQRKTLGFIRCHRGPWPRRGAEPLQRAGRGAQTELGTTHDSSPCQCCGTLGKSLSFSGPQCPHLSDGACVSWFECLLEGTRQATQRLSGSALFSTGSPDLEASWAWHAGGSGLAGL